MTEHDLERRCEPSASQDPLTPELAAAVGEAFHPSSDRGRCRSPTGVQPDANAGSTSDVLQLLAPVGSCGQLTYSGRPRSTSAHEAGLCPY